MTKRHSALLGVIIASAVAGASPAATANVVLTSDAAFGANAVIRDVSHGRDFLRLDFTTPYTYNQVLAQLGGLFSGWTVASEVDRGEYLVNASLFLGRLPAAVDDAGRHEVAGNLMVDYGRRPDIDVGVDELRQSGGKPAFTLRHREIVDGI